jgi:hypothetical protein
MGFILKQRVFSIDFKKYICVLIISIIIISTLNTNSEKLILIENTHLHNNSNSSNYIVKARKRYKTKKRLFSPAD